jgi:hypothetical protein
LLQELRLSIAIYKGFYKKQWKTIALEKSKRKALRKAE